MGKNQSHGVNIIRSPGTQRSHGLDKGRVDQQGTRGEPSENVTAQGYSVVSSLDIFEVIERE